MTTETHKDMRTDLRRDFPVSSTVGILRDTPIDWRLVVDSYAQGFPNSIPDRRKAAESVVSKVRKLMDNLPNRPIKYPIRGGGLTDLDAILIYESFNGSGWESYRNMVRVLEGYLKEKGYLD